MWKIKMLVLLHKETGLPCQVPLTAFKSFSHKAQVLSKNMARKLGNKY